MRKLKIQNRVGRSVATLPTCALIASVLWWWPRGNFSRDHAVSLFLVALTAYILAETNNANMILRARSRMISSVWLFACGCLEVLHAFQPVMLGTFCLAVCYYLLFRTYKQTQPVVDVFHSYVMLAMGAIFYPPLLLFAPVFLWHLLVFMRSLTLRSFFAAGVGLLAPFWFWAGWLLIQGDFGPLTGWWSELMGDIRLVWPMAPQLLVADRANWPFLLLLFLTLWTTVYYLLNNYDDKIRTRMMMYIYLCQSWLIVLFQLATSDLQHSTPLLLLSVCPLLAHYFTLRNTWTAMVMFFLTMAAFIIIFVNPAFISE